MSQRSLTGQRPDLKSGSAKCFTVVDWWRNISNTWFVFIQRRSVTSSASWECNHVNAPTKSLKTRTHTSSSWQVGVWCRPLTTDMYFFTGHLNSQTSHLSQVFSVDATMFSSELALHWPTVSPCRWRCGAQKRQSWTSSWRLWAEVPTSEELTLSSFFHRILTLFFFSRSLSLSEI